MASQARKTKLHLSMLKDMLRSRLCLEIDIDDVEIYDLRDIFEDVFPSWDFPTPEKEGNDDVG